MASKLKIIIPVLLLVVGGGVYRFVLAKPAVGPKPKIDGMVYVLPKEFLVNLSGGHFAKLGVGLVISEKDTSIAAAAADKDLIDREGRERLKKRILEAITKNTDVKAEDVLFTDVAVQ